MKYIATVEAMLPELKGSPYIDARGESTICVDNAIGAAFRHLLESPRVGRRNITTIKATVSIAKIKETPDEGT